MNTNQTIDGVPRHWAEIEAAIWGAFADGDKDYRGCTRERLRELRALLDAVAETPEQEGIRLARENPLRGSNLWGDTLREGEEFNRLADAYYEEAQKPQPAPQPQGEPVAYLDLEKIQPAGMAYATKMRVNHRQTALYAEQPAPVAVASLEIVGRQCFPSEAMKAVHGYRKEPWVDGEIDQMPSETGFYRVEPLVRLSDVTTPVAVVMPERREPNSGN